MRYELILPAELSEDGMIEQMARAVWGVLAADPMTLGLYQGYYVTVLDALQGGLDRWRTGAEPLGRARSVRLVCDEDAPGAGLHVAFAREIVARCPEIFDDVRAVHLVTEALPTAIREVLDPYLWAETEPLLESGAAPEDAETSRRRDEGAAADDRA